MICGLDKSKEFTDELSNYQFFKIILEFVKISMSKIVL
jgi:hypothetical protein